jgi:predicted enzyme related to lactoylglutathione lyase
LTIANTQGTPIWYELITGDANDAERFYGHVLGWRFSRPPGGMERDYRIAETDGIRGLAPRARTTLRQTKRVLT